MASYALDATPGAAKVRLSAFYIIAGIVIISTLINYLLNHLPLQQ
jgi:hypothetical protein